MVEIEFSEGYATSEGFRIHYLEWGKTGKNIVLLHSMMMDAHRLDIFSEAMAKDNHMLAVDLLGHGESDKPVIKISLEQHTEIVRGIVKERRLQEQILVGMQSIQMRFQEWFWSILLLLISLGHVLDRI